MAWWCASTLHRAEGGAAGDEVAAAVPEQPRLDVAAEDDEHVAVVRQRERPAAAMVVARQPPRGVRPRRRGRVGGVLEDGAPDHVHGGVVEVDAGHLEAGGAEQQLVRRRRVVAG